MLTPDPHASKDCFGKDKNHLAERSWVTPRDNRPVAKVKKGGAMLCPARCTSTCSSWTPVTTRRHGGCPAATPWPTKNFGLDAQPSHAQRYQRAAEFVEVAQKLWDSWEDDAIVADPERGVWAKAGKVHAIDHRRDESPSPRVPGT